LVKYEKKTTSPCLGKGKTREGGKRGAHDKVPGKRRGARKRKRAVTPGGAGSKKGGGKSKPGGKGASWVQKGK